MRRRRGPVSKRQIRFLRPRAGSSRQQPAPQAVIRPGLFQEQGNQFLACKVQEKIAQVLLPECVGLVVCGAGSQIPSLGDPGQAHGHAVLAEGAVPTERTGAGAIQFPVPRA